QLIITAGPWSSVLLADLGVPMELTRHVLGWFWPSVPARFTLGAFPIFGIQDDDDESLVYGFPMGTGRPGFKIARHIAGAPVMRADELNRTPDAEDEAALHAAMSAYFPDGVGPLLSMHVCMYTNSPDRHFIVDRHPVHEQVLVACGFSGHGFKFASVIGEALADLAVSRTTSLPIDFLRLSRFAQQA
ncbi:MAG: FAD-dependent oxidoreductase, partial [Phycisphaerales bacterium]|nr:FAD-dependent oxidoreductase [Phycisphaerales bacterium]